MYCYTYMNQFTCVFNELQLWSHISSDHPIFIKTVASLSNIKLSKPIIDGLNNIHNTFLKLYNNAVQLKKSTSTNPAQYAMHVKKLIDEFIYYDTRALSFYPQLLTLAKANKAWQELVRHIINEQAFMLELFKNLRQQIR